MRVSLIYKGMLWEPTTVRNGRPGKKCIADSTYSHVANLLLNSKTFIQGLSCTWHLATRYIIILQLCQPNPGLPRCGACAAAGWKANATLGCLLIGQSLKFQILHAAKLFPFAHWFQNCFCFCSRTFPSHVNNFFYFNGNFNGKMAKIPFLAIKSSVLQPSS